MKVESFKNRIREFFFREYLEKLKQKEREIDNEANRRLAEMVSRMDPLEPLMRKHSVVFSDEFERVEDDLDDKSRMMMAMWAYGQKRDPYQKRMIDWIVNTAGNEMLKSPARTNEDRGEILLWGKSQISNMILYRKEIGRLSVIYEEKLAELNGKDFDDEGKLLE